MRVSENQLSEKMYAGRPSVCRNCGALVGAGEETCAQCGTAQGGPARPAQAEQELPHHAYEMSFARAILGRPYIFTIIFLVANIFVFLLMWHSGGLTTGVLFDPSSAVLIAYGAKLNSLIRAPAHEWWRFVTPVFIHVGVIHLLVNMYSLWVIGPYVEKLYGSAKFVVFWVVTGAAGVWASYLTVRPDLHVNSVGRFLFKAADTPSAGASGALFGLVGVLFVFGIKFRHELPEGFKRAFGTGLLPMIMLNLFIGYVGRGFIDNAAHLGGFVSGALLALVVGYKRPGERAAVSIAWQVLQAAALLLVALSFFMVVRHFPSQLPKGPDREEAAEEVLPNGREIQDFVANLNAVNEAQTVFIKAFRDGDASGIDKAIEALDGAPHLDEETDNIRADLKTMLTRARTEAAPLPKPVKLRDAQARSAATRSLFKDFQDWQQRYEKWTDNEAARLGVKLTAEKTPQQGPEQKKQTPGKGK